MEGITKDELRLITVRARIATTESRLAALRDMEAELLEAIGRDPLIRQRGTSTVEQFEAFVSSGEFLRRLKEIGEAFIEMQAEEATRTDGGWRPLAR